MTASPEAALPSRRMSLASPLTSRAWGSRGGPRDRRRSHSRRVLEPGAAGRNRHGDDGAVNDRDASANVRTGTEYSCASAHRSRRHGRTGRGVVDNARPDRQQPAGRPRCHPAAKQRRDLRRRSARSSTRFHDNRPSPYLVGTGRTLDWQLHRICQALTIGKHRIPL